VLPSRRAGPPAPPAGATLFMSSQPAHTPRTTAPPRRSGAPQPAPASRGGGLDVGTLVIAAISSVVAATVVSRVWQAGTVMATAMTPVIVALVKEGLERPARRVSSIATRTAAAPVARASRAVAEPPPEAYAPPPPVADAGLSEMRVYRRERGTRRRWKLAVGTGLLACMIAIAAMTLPELVAGRSVVSGSHHTTIFGGHRSTSSSKSTTTTDEKQKTSTDETTSTDTQPQDTTTQPDTTTTAPDGQTQTQPPAAAQPQTSTQPPAQTQPPAATQPQTTTQPPATTP
jgi:hypothetical protein